MTKYLTKDEEKLCQEIGRISYRHDRLREALVEAMSYNTDMPINEYERIRLLLEKIQPTE